MDPRSQEFFDSILKKSPRELTETEIVFLRARRDYLKDSQKEEYRSVLIEKEVVPEQTMAELKEKATNLGLKFKGNISRKDLLALLAAAPKTEEEDQREELPE